MQWSLEQGLFPLMLAGDTDIETGILVNVIAMWYVNCFVYFLLTHIRMIV